MAFVEEKWQTTRPTIGERCKFMFNNELLSDVKFVVPESSGESESKKVIPAHKFVLSISSPVFLAMFYGEIAETKDSVELPDCEYDSLLELFRYMYSDEVTLTGTNAMQVLYLAKKYIVPSLANKCAKYLRENMEPSNAFVVLPLAQKVEENDLVDRCWEVICNHTDEALQSDGFVTLERSLVESVVKKDLLNVKEVELFQAVDRWASSEIERQQLAPQGDVKRNVIGEEIVKNIRFPLMSLKEFAAVVPDCNILTMAEIFEVVKYYADATSPLQFLQAPRSSVILRRFGKTCPPAKCWKYTGNHDSISLSVDKAIDLLGVHLFGCEGGYYTASMEVKLVADGSTSSLVKKSGTFLSIKDETDDHYGFDVLFDSPVRLESGVVYDIQALIEGPVSWYGQEGKSSVECSGVTFAFSNCKSSSCRNGTDVTRGQFPAIIFR